MGELMQLGKRDDAVYVRQAAIAYAAGPGLSKLVGRVFEDSRET